MNCYCCHEKIDIPEFVRVPHGRKGLYDIHPLLSEFSEEAYHIIYQFGHIQTPQTICSALFIYADMRQLTTKQIDQLNMYLPMARKIWVHEVKKAYLSAGIFPHKTWISFLHKINDYPGRLRHTLSNKDNFKEFSLYAY